MLFNSAMLFSFFFLKKISLPFSLKFNDYKSLLNATLGFSVQGVSTLTPGPGLPQVIWGLGMLWDPKDIPRTFSSPLLSGDKKLKLLPILSVLFIQGKLAFHTVSIFVPSASSYRKLEFSQKREKYYTQCIHFHALTPVTILLQSGFSSIHSNEFALTFPFWQTAKSIINRLKLFTNFSCNHWRPQAIWEADFITGALMLN